MVHRMLLVLLLTASLGAGQSSDKKSDAATLTGCLQNSTGHYGIVDENGSWHELSGGARRLKNSVGRQITVSGKPGTRSVSTTAQGTASGVMEIPVFDVKSVEHVGDKCNSGR